MPSSNKIALITGANKGIGFEVARQLGKQGCTVLVAARDNELGQEAAAMLSKEGIDARFVELDVTRRETIEAARAQIEREFGRLDILINNAGINVPGDGPPSKVDLDAVNRVLQTNFVGALAVAQAMLPLIRSSAAGRIVNVSSELGSVSGHSDPNWKFAPVKLIGYCASKAAMNMMTVQLAYELRDTTIKVNSANPGYTATDLNNHQGPQTIEEGSAETVRLALIGDEGPSGQFLETGGQIPW
ncbi:MAG TPA: SDR family oxidoreductase [Candidatus Sulfotelmatobacter sp.]|nr:SDR family oxidoreductase [Candidatus Sulfotelmatobacter sp.]